MTNLGLVTTGTGDFINVTQQIGASRRGFFRLRRLSSDPTTAVFNPVTGILTITGDDQDNTIVPAGCRRRHVPVGSRRRQRRRRRPGRRRHACLQRQQRATRSSTSRPQRRQHRQGPQRRRKTHPQRAGETDSFTINNLAGTDLTSITAELAGTLGGSTGDAPADVITVNGTASPDTISLLAKAGTVEVSGLAALVQIRDPEVANDRLVVNGLGGVDTITTGPGVTALIGVTANQ